MPDVVVVGAGIEGCAAAHALTSRGVDDVVVLERDTLGSGGTGSSSAVARCHYGVGSLAALAQRSLATLENAPDVLGTDIGFVRTGYVVGVGESDVDALDASLAGQRSVGVHTERIDHADVAAMWPVADLEAFAAFAFEPRGGYGDAHRTAAAFMAAARRSGARLRQSTPVRSIAVDHGRVEGVVLADGDLVPAGTVVVAAGPWSPALLSPLGLDLPITPHREQLVVVDPGQDLGGVPVLSDLVSLQYLRTEPDGRLLVGNSDLAVLDPVDPDHLPRRADAAHVESAVAKLAARLPGIAAPSVASTHTGCYDVTPDFNPVVSRTPVDGLVVAAGFSGHGFKISPAVGTLVADLVVDGTSSMPDVGERDFRWSRFAEGDLLRSPHPYVGAGQMR